MQVQYPKFFDDYEDKQAVLGLLGRGAIALGRRYALPWLTRSGLSMARAAKPVAEGANRTWGQWGWNAAKNVGGAAGTMMAADTALGAMGWGGGEQQPQMQPGQQPNDTASMALLQAAMRSPDPAHRLAAQQYLQQNFGFNPNSFQPQQPQNMGDMTLNGMMNMFGRQPNSQASSPFFQGQQAQQQPRTVYVPLMPQGTPQPAQPAPQMAARPDEGQPPAPAPSPVAARPAAGQPPAPEPAMVASRPTAGQPPAPSPRPMAVQPSPQVSVTAPAATAIPRRNAGPDLQMAPGMNSRRTMLTGEITMPPRAQPAAPAAVVSQPLAKGDAPLPNMTVRNPSYADAVPFPVAGRPGGQPATVGQSRQVALSPQQQPTAPAMTAARPVTGVQGLPPSPPLRLSRPPQPPASSIVSPPVKPLPAGLVNMPTVTAAAPAMPWFLRGKEAAAGGLPFFREDG